MSGDNEKILTRDFMLCFWANFLFFGTNFYLIPILPVYLKELGNNNTSIGVIIGAFSFSAIFLRPLMGCLADSIPKRRLMLAGTAIFIVSPLLYLTTTSAAWLTLIRIAHGMGLAAYAVGSITFVAQIAPRKRLSQATGIFVTSVSLVTGIAPIVATHLKNFLDLPELFMVPSIASAVAAALVLLVREPAARPHLRREKHDFIGTLTDRHVLVPSLVFAGTILTLGAITAFLPLLVINWEYNNPALFFVVYSAVMVIMRLVAGSVPDRLGHERVVVPCLCLVAVAMLLLARSHNALTLAIAAIVFATGYSLAYPSLNALVVEHVPAHRRGASLGIFSASVDLGNFLGPVFIGLLADVAGLRLSLAASGLTPLLGAWLFAHYYLSRQNKVQVKHM
ncbi:MFS transporter [Desulfoscipio geothermicus]|uniref:Predicted arabinose efflux permease, MFS family n=1 Tax=Desulfoscipio geothermicus DSM 3669 TaxID=1121426 RepID=A0A1I6CPA4_9FIRM|nr:MFS transporter [Desulfoscipio geothermicus]SFQ94969.1 Predicted arabinose efflux permease, MFS family [Desulfoscipio geothermicus DSM 3669]